LSTRAAGTFTKSDANERHQRGLAQYLLAARIAPEAKRVVAMRLHRKAPRCRAR
jgi:hypothetical protein